MKAIDYLHKAARISDSVVSGAPSLFDETALDAVDHLLLEYIRNRVKERAESGHGCILFNFLRNDPSFDDLERWQHSKVHKGLQI